MEIRHSAVSAVTVLDPAGKLVLREGESDSLLKNTITSLMHQGRCQFMVNLAHVSQVDTSGLASLVAAQITSLIGAGEMGEVYRARDTKLHRDSPRSRSCRTSLPTMPTSHSGCRTPGRPVGPSAGRGEQATATATG